MYVRYTAVGKSDCAVQSTAETLHARAPNSQVYSVKVRYECACMYNNIRRIYKLLLGDDDGGRWWSRGRDVEKLRAWLDDCRISRGDAGNDQTYSGGLLYSAHYIVFKQCRASVYQLDLGIHALTAVSVLYTYFRLVRLRVARPRSHTLARALQMLRRGVASSRVRLTRLCVWRKSNRAISRIVSTGDIIEDIIDARAGE